MVPSVGTACISSVGAVLFVLPASSGRSQPAFWAELHVRSTYISLQSLVLWEHRPLFLEESAPVWTPPASP